MVTKTPDNVRLLKKAYFKTRITAHFFPWYFQNIIIPFLGGQNLNILHFGIKEALIKIILLFYAIWINAKILRENLTLTKKR